MFTPAPLREAQRNRAQLLALNRGDGSGNAGLWPVLPVGAGTAGRSPANDASPPAQNRGDGGALASSPGGGLRPASRGSAKPAPTTLRPANLTAANGASSICVESRGRLGERRPPASSPGGGRHRWAKPSERRIATRAESRGHGALASSPGGGLRPASRGSAKPAPTTLRPANLTAANGVSPICVESRGRLGERRPPVGTRGSAKPAPMTVRRTDVSGAPPAQSGLRCSLRFAQRCRPEVGVPVPVRRLCSIRTAPLAPLRGAVPAPTGRTGQRSAFPCLRVACAQSGLRRPPACGGLCRPPPGELAGGRRSLARRSRRAPKVKGENPPFHTFPRTRLAANEVRCRWFFARSGERRQPQAGGWDSPPNSGMAPTAARTSACTVAPRPVALRILLIHKHPRGSSGREPQRGQVTRPAIFGNPNRGALPYSLPLAPSRRGRPGSLASCLAERRFPVVCCSWVRWRPDSSSAEWFR